MPRSISILVNDMASGIDQAPQFLVERHGAWQDFRGGSPDEPMGDLQVRLAKVLDQVMQIQEQNATQNVMPLLEPVMRSIYEQIVPGDLRALLDKAASDHPDDPPELRFHYSKRFDWLPWELLCDPVTYLGCRFQIARFPIAPTIPEIDESSARTVSSIRNLLAKGVFHNGTAHLKADWQSTFNPPPAIDKADKDNASSADVSDALGRDILHLTCHGVYDDATRKYYWAMDPTDGFGFLSGIHNDFFAQRKLAQGRPLVFANACAYTGAVGGLIPGFGRELYMRGAQNTIGVFARLSQSVAIPFARDFYSHLLDSGLSIGNALVKTKRQYHKTAIEPSHLFYALYGPATSRYQYV